MSEAFMVFRLAHYGGYPQRASILMNLTMKVIGVFRMQQSNTNWKMRFAQWMQGRYGIDELTQALMVLGCVLVVLNFILHFDVLYSLSIIAFVLGTLRCFSRNYTARTRELAKYQELMVKPKQQWRLLNKRYENRSTTIYFKCKGCDTVLNIPKGKGKLLVTCPKCGTKVEKRS